MLTFIETGTNNVLMILKWPYSQSDSINPNPIRALNDHKILSFEDHFIHSPFEAASLDSLNLCEVSNRIAT